MIHIFVVVAVFSSVVCSLRLGDIECSAELLSITEGGDGVDGGRVTWGLSLFCDDSIPRIRAAGRQERISALRD